MLCLSGFELYSRWVPLILVFQRLRNSANAHSLSSSDTTRLNSSIVRKPEKPLLR